jgi:pimeloyl-ACP methyl ester carboxylesterase
MHKPTLIYIPGLDGTGKLLHRQQDLYENYHVLCEAYPQDRIVSYDELAATAAAHLETVGRPAVVVAESFGGAVALMLALKRPELIARLVLVNTFAHFPRRWLIRLGAWLGRYFPERPSPPWTRFRGRFFVSPDVPREWRLSCWEHTSAVPTGAFGRRMALIAKLDLRPRLREIRIPALVLAAPDDRIVPCRAGQELARLLPKAHLIEPRVGHSALVHPDVNVRRLLAEPSYWPVDFASGK